MKKPLLDEDAKIIEGRYHEYEDWVKDPRGYFLIRVHEGKLELGHCENDNIIKVLIRGDTPQEVYFTAIKKGLIKRLDHAAYVGKELEKAYISMKLGKEYVQDEELLLE